MKGVLFILVVFLVSLSVLGMMQTPDVGIRFSHKLHESEVGLVCADCHAVAESQSASDDLIPGHDNCYICHEEDDTECSYCHTNEGEPQGLPDLHYIAKFPHAPHVEDDNCATCHAGIAASTTAALGAYMPSMQSCQECHSNLEQVDYCYVCHGMGEELAPADHRLDWRQAHGLADHVEADQCAMCHTGKQCLDCHDGDNLDRQVHPLNYVNNHAIDAKNKRDNCYTCHEDLQSCVTCHREQLVLPRSHNTAGWANLGNGGRHARQARLDLELCRSCHHESLGEPSCARCHGSR